MPSFNCEVEYHVQAIVFFNGLFWKQVNNVKYPHTSTIQTYVQNCCDWTFMSMFLFSDFKPGCYRLWDGTMAQLPQLLVWTVELEDKYLWDAELIKVSVFVRL